jgi:hypothetical protein
MGDDIIDMGEIGHSERPAMALASGQGLTLVHFSVQRKQIWWDTLAAWFSPSPLDRGTREGVTKTA